jgi:hypothetical protein
MTEVPNAPQLLKEFVRTGHRRHLQPEDYLPLKALLEIARRVAGENTPIMDDRNAVAKLLGFVHVMGGQQHRLVEALAHPIFDKRAQRAGRLHVEAQRRFIQEQNLGVGKETAHEVHLLAHPGREVVDLGFGPIGQTDNLQQLPDAGPGHFPVDPIELSKHPQVLFHG